MQKKIIPIKYTSRDFNSIKSDLIEHAKRYYADVFKDFNEGTFSSLMLDTVAYVGDILSFYLDYQANEVFLDTATEYNNILKLARQMGYKFTVGRSSSGVATFYIEVPSNLSYLGPDLAYAPILKKGSGFSTESGTRFILNEDVRFDLSTNSTVPLKIGSNGNPITWGIKAYGNVISGLISTEVIDIGEYEKFKKIKLNDNNIIEIISVFDSEGNEYFEVDHLSQNVIYKSVSNKDPLTAKLSKEILKPYIVPRRFTVETDLTTTYLQFGASSDLKINSNNSMLADPGSVVLQLFGKEYISSDSFDPTVIQSSDKFGISPSNTKLFVTYRYNPIGAMLNFAHNSIVVVNNAEFMFNDQQNLNPVLLNNVKNSLEVTNEAAIVGDARVIDSNELKIRIKSVLSTQSRAVTLEDYKSISYSMPTKFGAIKRVNVVKDEDSFKRNLNLYVLCEDENGYLCNSNYTVKQNLKTWILKNKMINDSIDILDGKVVNYGIEFVAVADPNKSKFDVLSAAIEQLRIDFSSLPEFGEPFFITDIWSSLRKVNSIVDVVSVKIVQKNGTSYSDVSFDIEKAMSSDKRYINVPLNVVMELKFPNSDIKGTIL